MIQDSMDDLTRSERQLASVLLQDYPMAGLQSITRLATAAGVSTPTVIRMARKLGFEGFPALQDALRAELAAQIKKPISKRDDWGSDDGARHLLSRFAEAVSEKHAPHAGPDRSRPFSTRWHGCWPTRAGRFTSWAAGSPGRTRTTCSTISRSSAPHVTQLGNSTNVWPQYLLDMDDRTVLVIFDIRRYEADLERLAKLASERGATVSAVHRSMGLADRTGCRFHLSRAGRGAVELGSDHSADADRRSSDRRGAEHALGRGPRADRGAGGDVFLHPAVPLAGGLKPDGCEA
ncbi:MurR/RpiR family transcriptional regulator [Jhaorihella thermophila]